MLVAGIFLFSSCIDEHLEVPNGVKLTLKTSHSAVLKNFYADSVIIDEAFIGVNNINFKPSGKGIPDYPEKIVMRGPYYFNLIEGDSNPEIKWIAVDPGLYKKIEIETSPTLQGRNTMIIEGTIKWTGRRKNTPFEFSTKNNFKIAVENNKGIQIKEDDVSELLVYFDLSSVLQDINLLSGKINENGKLIINDDNNADVIKLLNIKLTAYSRFLSMNDFSKGLFDNDDAKPGTGDMDNDSNNESNNEETTSENSNTQKENPGRRSSNEPGNVDDKNKNNNGNNEAPEDGNTPKKNPADKNKEEPGTSNTKNVNTRDNDTGIKSVNSKKNGINLSMKHIG